MAVKLQSSEGWKWSGKHEINQSVLLHSFESAMFHLNLVPVQNKDNVVRFVGGRFVRSNLNVYLALKNIGYIGMNTVF